MHHAVLTTTNASKLSEFKGVSVTKKAYGQSGIMPIHCAAINPIPDILKGLLESCPEHSIPDEILRKPIHYAAACEGPGPLNHLIFMTEASVRVLDKDKMTPLMIAAQ